MPDAAANPLDMLLVEPATLLRRTVSLTARTMGVANVHEAATYALALRLLNGHAFDGAVIAFEQQAGGAELAAMDLLDRVREGGTASRAQIPIAVMVDRIDAAMLAALKQRGVTHVLLKPFKARKLLDTFAHFATSASAPAPAARPLFGVVPD